MELQQDDRHDRALKSGNVRLTCLVFLTPEQSIRSYPANVVLTSRFWADTDRDKDRIALMRSG